MYVWLDTTTIGKSFYLFEELNKTKYRLPYIYEDMFF